MRKTPDLSFLDGTAKRDWGGTSCDDGVMRMLPEWLALEEKYLIACKRPLQFFYVCVERQQWGKLTAIDLAERLGTKPSCVETAAKKGHRINGLRVTPAGKPWRERPRPLLAGAKGVICVETGERFRSIRDASKFIGAKSRATVQASCRRGYAARGLHFRFADDATYQPGLTHNVKVVCRTTGMVFGSMSDAIGGRLRRPSRRGGRTSRRTNGFGLRSERTRSGRVTIGFARDKLFAAAYRLANPNKPSEKGPSRSGVGGKWREEAQIRGSDVGHGASAVHAAAGRSPRPLHGLGAEACVTEASALRLPVQPECRRLGPERTRLPDERGGACVSSMRNGNPLASTRGNAHKRAKAALGDALDARLNLDVERMELSLLASVIGVGAESVRTRLDGATLGELIEWREKIGATRATDGEKGAA